MLEARAHLILGPAVLLAACSDGPSLSLYFPNAEARAATRRLVVQSFAPGTVGASNGCPGLMQALMFDELAAPSTTADRSYPLADDRLELSVPTLDTLLLASAYTAGEAGAPPSLAACVERIDPGDTALALKVLLPESARVLIAGGDAQVGLPATSLVAPLVARVLADRPGGGIYPIAGVVLRFSSDSPEVVLAGGDGASLEQATDGAGEARAWLALPTTAGPAEVEVRSPEIEAQHPAAQGRGVFRLGVVAPVSMASRALDPARGAPVELAAAPGGGLLAVLGCDGPADSCTHGQGAAALTVYRGSPPAAGAEVLATLGIAPAGVVVGELRPEPGLEIAVLNGRRTTSEGAEVHLLADRSGGLQLLDRLTLTASNAVGLALFNRGGRQHLAVAGAGRSTNSRYCSTVACLPSSGQGSDDPADWGCPAAEVCACPGCSTGQPGVCMARDQMVDFLIQGPGGLSNQGGCQQAQVVCEGSVVSCGCLDAERGGSCVPSGSCQCQWPRRVCVGSCSAPSIPYALAAGALSGREDSDLVVVAGSGLELYQSGALQVFEGRGAPAVSGELSRALVASLDGDAAEDVVFLGHGACGGGDAADRQCPVLGAAADAPSCLGVLRSGGFGSVLLNSLGDGDRCRRYPLSIDAQWLCAGKVNADQATDVVLASPQGVVVLFGDGGGGLSYPPLVLEGAGGPVACADLDGDGWSEIVVAEQATHQVRVMSAR